MAETGRLFGRRCKVLLEQPLVSDYTSGSEVVGHRDAVEINAGDSIGMRVQFKIKKSDEKEPNTAEITVSNLSEQTRQSITKKGLTVTVDAGYEQTGIARIFRGDARFIDHVRNGADFDTVIKCGDGERGSRFAKVNEAFAAGTLASDIVERLVDKLGIGIGSNIDTVKAGMTHAFYHGYSIHGSAMRALDHLLKSMRYEWSIQDGAIIILKKGQPLAQDHIPAITPTSGLIGSPEMGTPDHKKKPALLKFKSLLLPTVPGRKVRLDCSRYHGYVDLKKVEIIGDTHGDEWSTTMWGQISGS